MRKKLIRTFIGTSLLVIAVSARAQEPSVCKMPAPLDKLENKAEEVVDVQMDKTMLKFAGAFLDSKKPEEVQAMKLIDNLTAICVRSLTFEKSTQYGKSDLDALRAQFRAPLWSRMVGVRSKGKQENVDVFLRTENGQVTGLSVIAAETQELTFVTINGLIRPEQLAQLSGQFGIPQVEIEPKSRPAGKEKAQ